MAEDVAERWYLRPELEFAHYVDSWYVREAPRREATPVAVLLAGEQFTVLSHDGDWLQLRTDSNIVGWSLRKFHQEDALVPIGGSSVELGVSLVPPPPLETPPPPLSAPSRQKSHEDRVAQLMEDLRTRRRALAAFEGVGGTNAQHQRVRAAAAVQDTMAKLELLGIDEHQLLSLEGPEALVPTDTVMAGLIEALSRETSFEHSEFSNPRQESCWLSTFFQSLWHSRVFHAAFDSLVRPMPPAAAGTALGALQVTWELYGGPAATGGERSDWRTPDSVPVRALQKAWGRGFGDCAEAFGMLQGAEDLQPLADLIALVPTPYTGRAPTPKTLWTHASEMGVADAPLLAFDLILPPLPNASIHVLASALAPVVQVESSPVPVDLGTSYRLVSMICYIEEVQHYVVFCRRLSDANHWMFFNDLPALARGARHELCGWQSVCHECARYGLCPRMLVYESRETATSRARSKTDESCKPM